MEHCAKCGRELPVRGAGIFCPDCQWLAHQTQNIPVPEAPATPARVATYWPPITTIIVGINVVVFVAMTVSGASPVSPAAQRLLFWGANWGPLSLGSEPWRMFTSNYVHAGIVHLAFNMWCLWNLGGLAERILGKWTYLPVYVGCGLAGSLASLWWHPMVVGVGASGAIFGVAGALIAALYLGKSPLPKSSMQGMLKSLVAFAGYNLFFGAVVPGIDNSAHIGGLIAGLLFGAALARNLSAPPETRIRWRWTVFIVAAIAIFGVFSFIRQTHQPFVPAHSFSSSGSFTMSAECPRMAYVVPSPSFGTKVTRTG